MAAVQLRDIKSIRDVLGKSQNEMAELLGVSLRAIQSYEQGWRPTPSYVQQAAALSLYLNWRKDGHRSAPCWKRRRCSADSRRTCRAYSLKTGDLCWLLMGTTCGGTPETTWDQKLAQCTKCPVMRQWMPERA